MLKVKTLNAHCFSLSKNTIKQQNKAIRWEKLHTKQLWNFGEILRFLVSLVFKIARFVFIFVTVLTLLLMVERPES